MNNIDPGDTSGDVLAILQEQLESRNKTTVVVESTVLIIFNIVALIDNAILCFNHRECYAFDDWRRH